MAYLQLLDRFEDRIFTILDIQKVFWAEKESLIRIQLFRFAKRGLLTSLKRGLYCLPKTKIDELELAGRLYQPSYLSLETALNYYGIIPDIPLGVTSVTPVTTKKISNQFGHFHYQKIKSELFWGYTFVPNYQIAFAEKALLDYFYIRRKTSTTDLRLDLARINRKVYNKFAKEFPDWVRKIKLDD
jgi:predicted transcriptional regulator of viral defense system